MDAKKKKVVLFPGAFQAVKNYDGFEGVDIWMGEEFKDEHKDSEYFIGHSAGASFAIRYAANSTSRYILVNPVIKKRGFLRLFVAWLKFYAKEGIRNEKIMPLRYWIFALRNINKIIKIDLLSIIKQLPNENIVIMRGKKDNFFCDEENVKLARENNLKVIEVDAGHDWNENIANVVKEIIN